MSYRTKIINISKEGGAKLCDGIGLFIFTANPSPDGSGNLPIFRKQGFSRSFS